MGCINKTNITFLAVIIIALVSCYKPQKEEIKMVKQFNISFEDTSLYDGYVVIDPKTNSNHIGKICLEIPYGGGMNYELPDSLINTNLRVIVSGKVRNKGWNTFGHAIVVGLFEKEKVNAWLEINMDGFVRKKDEWNQLVDSVQISSDRNQIRGAILKVFGYNGSKKSFMEYDDLKVEIKTVK